MDYNWLENIPSSVTALPVYQPDFSFLQSMQMKANQQYEQGLKEVKGKYDAIFNQPVTGEEAAKRQQQYKTQALDRMKAVSATDLSNPKNVLAAENIMAPFSEDKLYLKNIALTSSFYNELQKQQQLKNSTDKEQRALYSPLIDDGINFELEKLAKSPMTAEAYDKIEKKGSIPVYSIEKDIKDEHPELFTKGGGIKTVNAQGVVDITSLNGPQSVDNYTALYYAFAKRDKYIPQNRAIASVQMQYDMKDLRDKNPGISDIELNNKYGEYVVTGQQKYFTDGIAANRATALKYKLKNSEYTSVDANGNYSGDTNAAQPDLVTAQKIKYNIDMAKQFTAFADDLEKKYMDMGYDPIKGILNTDSKEYKKAVQDIATNPRDYVANVYMAHNADRWAKGMATVSSVEITENAINKIAYDRAQQDWKNKWDVTKYTSGYEQKDQALAIKAVDEYRKLGRTPPDQLLEDAGMGGGENALNKFGTTGAGSGISGTAGGTKGGPATPSIESGTVGQTGLDLAKINAMEALKTSQSEQLIIHHREAFGTDGLLLMLGADILPKGLNASDVISASGQYTQSLRTGKYNTDPASVAVRQHVIDVLNSQGLEEFTTEGVNTSPTRITQALSTLVTKDAMDPLFKTVDEKKQSIVMQLAYVNQNMQQHMAVYNKRETEYQEKIKEFFDSDTKGVFNKIKKVVIDPNTNKPLIDPKTNKVKYDVIDAKDVADDFKKFGVYNVTVVNSAGEVEALSNEKLANAFLQNDFKFPSYKGAGYDFQIGDSYYNISSIGKLKYNKENIYNIGGNKGVMMKVLTDAIGYPESNKVTSTLITGTNPTGWGIVGKYGPAKEVKEKINKIETDVIGQMSEFKTGQSGYEVTYDMSGTGKDEVNPVQKATGVGIYKEIMLPNNQLKMYTTNDERKMDKPVDSKIKAVLQDHTQIRAITDLVDGITRTDYGPNGVPAIKITFSTDSKGEKDKASLGKGVLAKDVKDLSTIYIDIAPDAKGTLLNQFSKPEILYTYGKLLNDPDAVLIQDTFEEKNGFKYTIKPDPNSMVNGRFTKVFFISQMWDVDKKTGAIVKEEDGSPHFANEVRHSFSLLSGETPINPDQLYKAKNDMINAELYRRKSLLKFNTPKPAEEGQGKMSDLFK